MSSESHAVRGLERRVTQLLPGVEAEAEAEAAVRISGTAAMADAPSDMLEEGRRRVRSKGLCERSHTVGPWA